MAEGVAGMNLDTESILFDIGHQFPLVFLDHGRWFQGPRSPAVPWKPMLSFFF